MKLDKLKKLKKKLTIIALSTGLGLTNSACNNSKNNVDLINDMSEIEDNSFTNIEMSEEFLEEILNNINSNYLKSYSLNDISIEKYSGDAITNLYSKNGREFIFYFKNRENMDNLEKNEYIPCLTKNSDKMYIINLIVNENNKENYVPIAALISLNGNIHNVYMPASSESKYNYLSHNKPQQNHQIGPLLAHQRLIQHQD